MPTWPDYVVPGLTDQAHFEADLQNFENGISAPYSKVDACIEYGERMVIYLRIRLWTVTARERSDTGSKRASGCIA